ncbi:MAG: adenylyltransferase/cytidyltransferase family protein [bacterium]|nr:adenylyltransferase/cytidyltransferase family protein [bacterium]
MSNFLRPRLGGQNVLVMIQNLSMNPFATENKIVTLEKLLPIIVQLKLDNKRIVTTNGCFDIIHPGHIVNLEWARSQGDVLIVGINSDESIRKIKGDKRPIVKELDRARVLAGLAMVDYVFVFNETNASGWLSKVHPRIHVKGKGSENDPLLIDERKIVEKDGGELRFDPYSKDYATTDIITAILEKHKNK